MRHALIGCCVLALLAPAIHGQAPATRLGISVSPSVVSFTDFGGGFGAAVGRLWVARAFHGESDAGYEVSVFGVAVLGGMTAMADCIPGNCVSRASPSAIAGGVLAGYAFIAGSPIKLTGGLGYVGAGGGSGFSRRQSGAVSLGIAWESRPTGFAFTAGVSALSLMTPVAGAGTLILPGVGFSW